MEIPQQDVYDVYEQPDIEPLVPADARAVLDVGCGRGGFGLSLRRVLGPAAVIHGIEPVASQAAASRANGSFDAVFDGYFPEAMPAGSTYDVISFIDVLEHLVDPWQALRDAAPHLSERGVVIASIPNVQYGTNLHGLIRGRWEYTDVGILDRTHLRFFTRSTSSTLFTDAGYEVLSVTPTGSIWKDHWSPALRRPLRTRLLRRALVRLAPDAEWFHFVVVARPLG